MKCCDIVPCIPQHVIALPAQQSPYPSCYMIMIDTQSVARLFATYPTTTVLCLKKSLPVGIIYSVEFSARPTYPPMTIIGACTRAIGLTPCLRSLVLLLTDYRQCMIVHTIAAYSEPASNCPNRLAAKAAQLDL